MWLGEYLVKSWILDVKQRSHGFPQQNSTIFKSKIVQKTFGIANMYKLDKNVLTRLNWSLTWPD